MSETAGAVNNNALLSLLIVDDEEEMCRSLAEVLSSHGFLADYLCDPRNVQQYLRDRPIDVMLMDIRMPGMGGLELLSAIRQSGWSGQVIVVSGYPSVENIVRAMKIGALNFYRKPVDLKSLVSELHQLASTKHRGHGKGDTGQRPRESTRGSVSAQSSAGAMGDAGASAAAETRISAGMLVTEDAAMADALKAARKAAAADVSVLLSGETGTGKELVAQRIYEQSPRCGKPFLKMNCAAVPDTLLESELFGHEAGAFTDAKERRKGKFEMADGGTLFFDEIGDMSMKTQAKLLRVLQDWQFERLGGTKTLEADVRVVSATNKDLRELAEDGSFRRDLYYRLAVVEIYIPALRERPDDIIPLAEHFLQAFNEKHGKSVGGIAPEVEALFLRHSWPGNVRELKNVVERAVIFCEGDVLGTQDLPAQYHEELPEHVAGSFREVHEAVSKQMILDALRQCNGVKHRAAEMLNMHRKTLYNKMKRLGIDS